MISLLRCRFSTGSLSIKSSQMDDLIDELPVEKRHLSKLIIICRIKLTGD